MVEKTLEQEFQMILHIITRLFTKYQLDVTEIKETGPKKSNQNWAQNFRFSSFRLWPLVSRLGQNGPSMFCNNVKCSL